jgi:S-adenosylmethionine:tRNA ribosyltransferase-isomerase
VNVDDFDFDLPVGLIAQDPAPTRGASRLLVLDRANGAIEHRAFSDLPDYLRAGDVLVLNNTRVFPARLLGRREPSGGAVEFLLLAPVSRGEHGAHGESPAPASQVWSALIKSGQKLRLGARVVFERDGRRLHGEVIDRAPSGRQTVRMWLDEGTGSVGETIDRIGHIPLPPYITRPDRPSDRERYQTVFARHEGSIAAPTAGLHFTETLLDAVRSRGVEIAEITLHVGYGTFKPVRVTNVESHEVDPEAYVVTPEAADALSRARREKRRIIAVGTTTTRVLESLQIDPDGRVVPASGETRTFIYPGHRFQLVDGLVTNFHLPRSSLLMLVAALAGRERVLRAYREAVAQRYRFYSYGDAMLIV